MHKLWIYVVIFFLFEEGFLTQGTTDSNIIVNTTTSPLKVYVNRKEVFNLGSDARLICSNRTQTESIFVIWNIELKHKTCKISFSNEGQNINSCNDGKSIQISNDQSFLHIPNFSASDVGTYSCESIYTGGNGDYRIAVGVTALPAVSTWSEQRSNKIVAVCRAERGIPAANISWSVIGNHSVTQQNDPDGFVTVESQLEVPEDIDQKYLTCIVWHQFWKQEKMFIPRFRVNRKEVFNLGSDARLICSNRTQTESIFVIWNIELKHKTCKISFSNEGQNINSCNDGKSIQISNDQSFLHIPNFSASDVGAYSCESTYRGGNEDYRIAVGITAPPAVSTWLERRGNKIVAVCRAERGIPAANISWSLTRYHSVTQQNDPDGFVTVESQLEIPKDINQKYLTCIVWHQFWKQEKMFISRFRELNPWIRIVVVFVIIIIGILIFALRKRRCQP
ncbi:cell surface glycoprotein CD200 receptor 1-like [Gambusia affinis]|uniref:cell surface glycoprotein CD200 receptor 1-like n=1 Tax=Gambusia affinis TaxID=33528 RepID=UPI001CDD1839|nr:cell surface glycoprotein CD200 receptor 1-like [Gambusia affinis]